jgi:hypothetical protein
MPLSLVPNVSRDSLGESALKLNTACCRFEQEYDLARTTTESALGSSLYERFPAEQATEISQVST